MIAIIDYGMGNLRSVQKAFEFVGKRAVVTKNTDDLEDASHIVLPGVGAAAEAMQHLRESGLDAAIKKQIKTGKPFLGICLGMQLLLEKSYENGEHMCLGVIPGHVRRFDLDKSEYKIPHMGWNAVHPKHDRLTIDVVDGAYVYFVHSYHAQDVPETNVLLTCEYGYRFTCGIVEDNVYGLQFHPEKSGDAGLQILKRFGELK